MKFLFVNSELF